MQARGAIRSAPEGATCGKTIAAKKSTPGLSYIKAHIQIVIICNSSSSISGYQYLQIISADSYLIWLCSTSDQIFPLNQMSHALNDTIIAKIEAVLIHFIFGIIIYTYLNCFLLFFCNSYFSSINLNITPIWPQLLLPHTAFTRFL